MGGRHNAVKALEAAFGTAPGGAPCGSVADLPTALLKRLRRDLPAIADDLRVLLDGPPLPVVHNGASAPACGGAKLVAIELLGELAQDQDAARFGRLAADFAEPVAVRVAAAEALVRQGGDDGRPALAGVLVKAFATHPDVAEAILSPFADRLPDLVRPLLGYLYHRDRGHRQQARKLLEAAGEAAVPYLVDLVRTAEDDFARGDAADVLRVLDPVALEQALAARQAEAAARPRPQDVRVLLRRHDA